MSPPPHSARWTAHLSADLPASVVVFLVALPLCLGIALASGAPLLAGLFSGMIGGLVVGSLSRSQLSVSGPAAGLTVIVADGIATLGSYSTFLMAVVLAGVLQVALGFLRAGVVAHFVPVSVVHGMLAAIGWILILKQIPHALGRDVEAEGAESFAVGEESNTFTELLYAVQTADAGPVIVFVVALSALLLWQRVGKRLTGPWLPPALVAVLAGVAANMLLGTAAPALQIVEPGHLVSIPDLGGFRDIVFALPFPDHTRAFDPAVWKVAATLAVIASVETLLSISATDKLDPQHRITPVDHELKAQGVGNIAAGALGGLPITAVIVRSSANIDAGAHTKLSAVVHGALLLLSVLVLAPLLGKIPLAALAAVLIVMGVKLTSVRVFRDQRQRGTAQFIPFLVTLLAILVTDLLVGVLIGVAVGIYFVIRSNFQSAVIVTRDGKNVLIRFAKDVSFLNKPSLLRVFQDVPHGANVLIDGTRAQFIDHDIGDAIDDFVASASARGIAVDLRRSPTSLNEFFKKEEAL